MYKILTPVLLVVMLAACGKAKKEMGEVDGFVPVYANPVSAKTIAYKTAQPVQNAGKIVVLGNTLYQVEVGYGLHIINIANPASPQRVGFIEIAGCNEMSIKNGYVFTNNLTDLVVLDISSPTAVNVVKRVENAFPQSLYNYPPEANVYFECADSKKGIVIGWTRTKIKNPKCRR